MQDFTLRTRARGLSLHVQPPFTVCALDEEKHPGQCRIHPHLIRLPRGRLVMTTNIDGDIGGAAYRAYVSDDGGRTWQPLPDWPQLACLVADLGQQSSLLVYQNGCYATDEPGVFRLPTRRSADGGRTWGELESARLELPLEMDEAIDIYDPPPWFLERSFGNQNGRQWLQRWQVPKPSPAEAEQRRKFGCRKIPTMLCQLLPVTGNGLLAFLYVSPVRGGQQVTVCLASDDGGRSWQYRSTPGPLDARFAAHGTLSHATNGLCEPSCTRLATGELFLVMRLGSWHPLYATTSPDDGRSWAPQAEQGPGCYYTGWPARPLAVHGILPTVLTMPNGALALCSGRPDVTLSLSLDDGYHWPWTHRFIEDNKPEEQGTYNNTMVQVGPNRLLLMYDLGGYHSRPPEFRGARRIVGHFIDFECG